MVNEMTSEKMKYVMKIDNDIDDLLDLIIIDAGVIYKQRYNLEIRLLKRIKNNLLKW